MEINAITNVSRITGTGGGKDVPSTRDIESDDDEDDGDYNNWSYCSSHMLARITFSILIGYEIVTLKSPRSRDL